MIRRDPPRPLTRRAALRGIVATASTVLLSACGGGDPHRPGSRRITRSEADVLAGLLVANYEAGGAHLRAVVPFGTAEFHLDGEIDWANHVGRITLTTSVAGEGDHPPRDVVWNPNVVFEQVPGLEERLAAQGREGVEWVARSLNPRESTLHLILRLINSTASTQPDNPQLLASRVTWLRADRVGRTRVDVYRNERTTYWVARSDHTLRRMEADLASTGARATITFSDRGPRVIETPPDPAIVALSEVAALYQELLGAQPH